MMRDNIFSEDVKVPEIVQKKAEKAFLAIQAERKDCMKQIEKKKSGTGKYMAKRLAAAAACMAVIIAAGAAAGPLRGILGNSGTGGDRGSDVPETEDALLTAMGRLDKMFTLQVRAEDVGEAQPTLLAERTPVPVAPGGEKAGSWVFCADDAEGSVVNYCIGLPQMICEGEQVESVTYSINNGAFQIVQPENEESIIVDGQLYDGALNTGSIGGDYNEERDGQPSRPFEVVLYQSFTLDYDRQSDEYTWMNICGERPDSAEIIEEIWSEDGSLEKYNSGVQKMLDNTVITCTVRYADNTSQSADIRVGSCIMTRREAGEPEEDGTDPEEKITVITFERMPETEKAQ